MWKVIKDYPNYKINENGDIRNIKTGYLLRQRIDNKGYARINLGNNRGLQVHRLVYFTFSNDTPKDNYVVDHKDGNVLNNNINNLQQIKYRENTLKGKSPNIVILVKNKDTGDIKLFKSAKEIAIDCKSNKDTQFSRLKELTNFTDKYELLYETKL